MMRHVFYIVSICPFLFPVLAPLLAPFVALVTHQSLSDDFQTLHHLSIEQGVFIKEVFLRKKKANGFHGDDG